MYAELQRMIQNIIENTKLMDYRIGTVKQLGPLVLDIGDNKQVTQFKDNLLFTEQLIKKRVTLTHSHNAIDLNHTHSNDAGETTAALAGAYPTTVKTMSFVINEGIDIGDKLLLLRAQGGQQWIVLSKLRDSSTVTIDQNGGWTWG